MRALVAPVLLLAACAKDAPVEPTAEAPAPSVSRPAPMPEPLPTPEFELPDTEVRTLSNGLTVVVATNDEVPLWDLRLLFRAGGYADPADKPGLASVTLDMLNEGADDLSAEELSRQVKALGSQVESYATADGAAVVATGMKRNLAPTLDLWSLVLLEPTFPQEDWELMRKRRIADLIASRRDPNTVAANVADALFYDGTYRGHLPTEAAYEGITTQDMRDWYAAHLGPRDAIVLVGGDVTADEIVPLLEERIGAWDPEGVSTPEPQVAPSSPEADTLYFVDQPGAAQSVIRLVTPAGERVADDTFAFFMANQVIGGNFTSRVNLNLREDKGYTYGARCGIGHRYGPEVWLCATSVRTDATAPALQELIDEVGGPTGDRPITADEIAYFTSSVVSGYPGQFETTGAILGQREDIWRFGLPEDWTERFLPGVKAVDAQAANEAYRSRVADEPLQWVVVGDWDAVGDEVAALGFDIVHVDTQGHIIEEGE